MLFDRFFYPQPPEMPPIVAQSMDDVLARLEKVLHEKAPAVSKSLQAGLSADQIAKLEGRLGFQLSDELRALYKWHNGMSPNGAEDFLPGHRFLPLEEAVHQFEHVKKEVASGSFVQRAAFHVFAGHRDSWLTILDSRTSDGYFYDHERQATGGAFFSHMAQMQYYFFFPSLKNFLAGTIQCFERGVYFQSADGKRLEEDFAAPDAIWRDFGARNSD